MYLHLFWIRNFVDSSQVTLFWFWAQEGFYKGFDLTFLKKNMTSIGTFLRRFSCIDCSFCEYKSTLRIWLQFKNLKLIIQLWSHYTKIKTLPNSPFFGINYAVSSYSIHCFWVKHFHNDPSLVTCDDILEKQVRSLLWKKTLICFLILLSKNNKEPTSPPCLIFKYFSRWCMIVDWYVKRSSTNSRVLHQFF